MSSLSSMNFFEVIQVRSAKAFSRPANNRESLFASPHFINRVLGGLIAMGLTIYGFWAFRISRISTQRKPLGKNPLVSVLIPTHNRADILLERSLASVLRQTYKNLEILVCAHGCTDRTEEMVSAIGDPRIRIVSVPRVRLGYPASAENHWLVGPVRPLNAGTKQAKGQFIAVIGDDDQWAEDHIGNSIRWLLERGDEFVSSQQKTINFQSDESFGKSDFLGQLEVGGVATWVYSSSLRVIRWNIHSWRKNWNRPNDLDFVVRIRRIGAKMSFMPSLGAILAPRPGERELGAKAYLMNPKKHEKYFSIKTDADFNET